MSSAVVDEHEPLLRASLQPSRDHDADTKPSRKCWPHALALPVPAHDQPQNKTRIISCIFCLHFLINFSRYIVEVPLIRLFEIAICDRYFHAEAIDEKSCKLARIQNDLAIVVGWRFCFDALPILLTAIFYGRLADKHGRRLVLFLSCLGLVCSLVWIVVVCYANQVLPIKLVWVSSAFLLVGGGQRIAKSMVFVILADILEQPERTRYMYLLASIPHLTTLVAPLSANLFMRINIWIPFAIAVVCLILSFFVIWAMPESLILHPVDITPHIASVDSTSTLLDDDQTSSLEEASPQNTAEQDDIVKTASDKSWSQTSADIRALIRVSGLPLCLALSFLRPIAIVSRAFVYQHASESFGWPMSSTTWLRFAQATSSSLATLVLLPLISAYLGQRAFRAKRLDLNAIRLSLLITSVGFAIIWRSGASWVLLVGLFVCGLGEGFEPSVKGLATSLIGSSSNARLLTLVTGLEVTAKLIGGPLMARLFSIGRDEGHGSDGICFLASAVALLLLAGVALVAKI
ncbi:MAG: hypothetical protein HETSPECPRED_007049 [Heterodermia speciosa]|uniref:Major facilitator superfamily (MFS) profile domain-containing protein n=1 Tax=Heterodermia speciosa TaxID=116794 RepID=A0A8H3EKX3_9LECA|nr:MAG: hypothetical protein HETSPECPRED_007049 [Heterodermia speciosa]